MKKNSVVLIADQNQENLGVGYLSSILQTHGFNVKFVNFDLSYEEIYIQVRDADPIVVGISLIFQYYIDKVRNLTDYLRTRGIDCHITVGGHYPSLRSEDFLKYTPTVDSVVRFEGEYTLCKLVKSIYDGTSWTDIAGLAYRRNGQPTSNPLRPLIEDLDALPFPTRLSLEDSLCIGLRYASILASRGCIRNCSFCSVRAFYGAPPGRARRIRGVDSVIQEMKMLLENFGVRIFLFQDDDFLPPGLKSKAWLDEFIARLVTTGLADNIIWKINCRADEINRDQLLAMKQASLRMVYLGIESGDQISLDNMNKNMSVQTIKDAVALLKELGLLYEFGFMLFEPYTSFVTIRNNLNFLREICADGSAPVVFGKMVPYAETPIEKKLSVEGRLIGTNVNPDYKFLDKRLEALYIFLCITVGKWMFSPDGLQNRIRWNRFELEVLKQFFPHIEGTNEYELFLQKVVADFNSLFFHIVESACDLCEGSLKNSQSQLRKLAECFEEELNTIDTIRLSGMKRFQEHISALK